MLLWQSVYYLYTYNLYLLSVLCKYLLPPTSQVWGPYSPPNFKGYVHTVCSGTNIWKKIIQNI